MAIEKKYSDIFFIFTQPPHCSHCHRLKATIKVHGIIYSMAKAAKTAVTRKYDYIRYPVGRKSALLKNRVFLRRKDRRNVLIRADIYEIMFSAASDEAFLDALPFITRETTSIAVSR